MTVVTEALEPDIYTHTQKKVDCLWLVCSQRAVQQEEVKVSKEQTVYSSPCATGE